MLRFFSGEHRRGGATDVHSGELVECVLTKACAQAGQAALAAEAEQLLADAASFQHTLAKRNADEVPQASWRLIRTASFQSLFSVSWVACQAWDAFNRYITEVMGKKQTLNVSWFGRNTHAGSASGKCSDAQEFLQNWLEGDRLR